MPDIPRSPQIANLHDTPGALTRDPEHPPNADDWPPHEVTR